MDPTNYQYTVLGFHFSSHIRRQSFITGINLARFQRASKGAQHIQPAVAAMA
jgi:hypothetical protein